MGGKIVAIETHNSTFAFTHMTIRASPTTHMHLRLDQVMRVCCVLDGLQKPDGRFGARKVGNTTTLGSKNDQTTTTTTTITSRKTPTLAQKAGGVSVRFLFC